MNPDDVRVGPGERQLHGQSCPGGLFERLVALGVQEADHVRQHRLGAGGREHDRFDVGGLHENPLHDDVRHEVAGAGEEVRGAEDGAAFELLEEQKEDY